MKNRITQLLLVIGLLLASTLYSFAQNPQSSLVGNILIEPVIYRAGPPFSDGAHAYFTFEVRPGVTEEFLNARIIQPGTDNSFWVVENVPLPTVDQPQVISYLISVEEYGSVGSSVQCEYAIGEFQEEENFPADISVLLTPQPIEFYVPSGSNDPPVSVLIQAASKKSKPKKEKTKKEQVLRGDDLPNIDLDKKTDRTDTMACGPAAAGNSIQWLIKKHDEMSGETSSLRSKVDSLKKYMNRSDKKGVRFDSMVVGKLTLIDALKLPIKVKYKTMHDSGHPKDDLASTKPPHHTPENKGPQQHPDYAWLKSEIDDGEDVEVQIGWYGPPGKDGKRVREGGHWMVAEGYITAGKIKGVYVKHDTNQDGKGGPKMEYFKWDTLPGGIPYLAGLKDDKGNIAIVESVVSESYDPTVTFDDAMSTVPSPWDDMVLTGEFMKPGYPFVVPVDRSSPWIPIGVGITGAGVLTYIVLQDEGPEDCSFMASTQVFNSLCGEPNGAASVVTSPAGEYDYNWSTGSTGSSITDLSPGSYSVTVTRRGTTCSSVLIANVININFDYTADISTTAAHCGSADGSATLAITPPADYLITWSNGGTGSSQPNLPAGEYMVTVSVGSLCSEVFAVTIAELPPDFNITLASTPAQCGMSDGTAGAIIDLPGSYIVSWSNGATGMEISGLSAGEYHVTVTLEGTSCQKTSSVIVSELPADLNLTFNVTPASCGASDGTVALTVIPLGAYDFVWSTGAMTSDISNVAPGEYQVTVTLAGTTCSETGSITVEELPGDFTLSFTTTPAGCGVNDGTATVVVDPPGAYDIVWSNNNTTSTISGVPAGEYQVTVTKTGTTCSASGSITIDELPANFTLSITTVPSSCGTSSGSASVVIDPPGTYSISWPGGSMSTEATGLAAGDYILTVTNSGGCDVTENFSVAETPADFIVEVITTPGNCLGEGAEIMITTQTHGSGPIDIVATGPDGIHIVTGPAGVTLLSTSFTILPGAWNLVVRDLSLASSCVEVTDVIVDDNTTLTTTDDVYETIVDQSVNGNVLTNDEGAQLTVIENTLPSGGTLTLNPDGSFTFTPPPGMSGQFTFQYTAQDACNNTATANVTINVMLTGCPFDATFTSTPSNCGLMTGSISTILSPPGAYTFLWSNGLTTQDVINIPAGSYGVTITSLDLNCSKAYNVDVGQVPNSYITMLTSAAGNCTGEGEITITLTTPGSGPLVLTVTGPDGTQQFTLPPGTHFLSSSMNIPSGDYTITVYDQGAGEGCSESANITVPDNTPTLDANDDFYETTAGTPVSGNLLDNDDGLDITLTDISQLVGGEVDFSSNGDFTFTPDPGFSGLASFVYTVTDACGTTAIAIVEIEVIMCDFTATFNNSNASCGFEDGSSTVIVNPGGTYDYTWSTGDSGPSITDVPAGFYTVTIEDVNLGCSLEFDTEVEEDPAMYITNIEIVQPSCPASGDIRFEVSSPGGGLFEITVTHPNGVDEFIVGEGLVVLSDHISIVDGDYHISVIDENAGPSCVDEFDATIMGSTMLEIMLEGVIPPSEPTAMDGAIIVVVSSPTVPPYTIYLDGGVWGLALDNTFVIEGVGAGPHTVQIEDPDGCFSNILEVDVPISEPLPIMIGFSVMTADASQHTNAESASYSRKFNFHSGINVALRYHTGAIMQESRLSVFASRENTLVRFEQVAVLGSLHYKKFVLESHTGLSIDLVDDHMIMPHWMIQGSASKRIGNMVNVSGILSFRGWEKLEIPVLEVCVKMPFKF